LGWRESVSSPVASQPDVGVVVVAAGAGVRAGPGEPKQFRPILGVPMLLRALRAFIGHPEVRQVVVVLPPGYAERPPEWLGKLRGERLGFVPGGAQRADSVRMLLANGVAVDDDELRVLRCLEEARHDSGVRELLAVRSTNALDCNGFRSPLERVR